MSKPHSLPVGGYEAARTLRTREQWAMAVRRDVHQMIEWSGAEKVEAWARSLTDTNCDWSHYEVAQIALAMLAERHAPDHAPKEP